MVTSDEVLKELVELRGASGLSALRVRDLAPKAMGLRAVDDHIQRKGLDNSDRHVAADAVIRCCVAEHLGRSDWMTIAERTLNFDGKWGAKLTDRRSDVMFEMALSEKQYGRLEQETYVQLAGVLVGLEKTGCSDDPKPFAMTDEMVVELIMGEQNKLVGILRVLRGLEPEQAGRLLVGQLPRAEAFIDRRRYDIEVDGLEIYSSFMVRAITASLPSRETAFIWYYEAGPDGDEPNVLAWDDFVRLFLACFDQWTDAPYWQREFAGDQRPPQVLRDTVILKDYFRRKGNSISYLADKLSELERADTWESILGGIGDRALI